MYSTLFAVDRYSSKENTSNRERQKKTITKKNKKVKKTTY